MANGICSFCGDPTGTAIQEGPQTIPACGTCFEMKGRMTSEEFLEHVKKICEASQDQGHYRKIYELILPQGEFLSGL